MGAARIKEVRGDPNPQEEGVSRQRKQEDGEVAKARETGTSGLSGKTVMRPTRRGGGDARERHPTEKTILRNERWHRPQKEREKGTQRVKMAWGLG